MPNELVLSSRNKEKGFVQVLLILLLLVGVGVAVWGIQNARTVLKPRASESNVAANPALQKIAELESSAEKIEENAIQGFVMVKIPVMVFEDLNKNGVKDEGEVGIPNINLRSKAFYSIDNSGDAIIGERPSWSNYLEAFKTTGSDGTAEFNWIGLGTTYGKATDTITKVKLQYAVVSLHYKGSVGIDFAAPFGWDTSNIYFSTIKFYPDIRENGNPLQINGDTILETAEIPLIGNQKITGTVFYDTNKNGIKDNDESPIQGPWVLLDASRADNATKRAYVVVSTEDGVYEFKDLPPLSSFRIKLSTACPGLSTTKPYEGFTLGSAGNVTYDFGVVYDYNDPCVTN